MAAAETAVVRVMMPVLETRLFPGRASMSAFAFFFATTSVEAGDDVLKRAALQETGDR